jgi:DNA polymerase elongation subunit (family B)
MRAAEFSGTRSPESQTHLEGWIFDVYPSSDGMILWVIDDQGHPHRVRHTYAPTLYVSGSRNALEMARQALTRLRVPVTLTPTTRQELMSGTQIPVTAVTVSHPLAFPAAARLLARVPGLTLYNCDILTTRLFFYETGLFPLARCAIDYSDGVAREIARLSRPEDLEYNVPSLVVLRLRFESPAMRTRDSEDAPARNPSHGRPGQLEASVDGETVVLDGDDPAETIRSLNRLLQRYDPDVLLTEWGDSVLLPQLQVLAARTGIPLQLNRDPGHQVRTRRSRSYMTYGQVVYQAGARMLHGRWHIDLRNSFIYGESELAGLLEVARLAHIPVQELARTSTGTAISSMQLLRAVRDGILIPWQKSEPEVFKTASQLIVTDKGGLTYQPLVGLYEQIGELDFSSMYPTIMARFNVSPETIGCACCPDSHVPEINYTVCRRRRGLVPQVLDHLLERRIYYKQRKQTTTGSSRALYDQRQTALKWCLVTCLGGDTLVLHRRAARWKISSIEEIVDQFLPDPQWGIVPVQDLAVSGIDRNLRDCLKKVSQVIKFPAPPTMIHVKVQWGRQLAMIPGHDCYVLRDGQLIIKRADQLAPGDWVPITTDLDGVLDDKESQIDLIAALKQVLRPEEQQVWRVFGRPVRRLVRERYDAIGPQARKQYTAKTVWNWREYGYLPLHYVDPEGFAFTERPQLSVGRGKREGGLIQRLPAVLEIDEDLGFLLGFFVGDGSVSGNSVRFDVGANEQEHLERLGRIIQSKFGVSSRVYRERKAQMFVLQVNSVALTQILERVLNIGKSAEQGKLHVPGVILNGPRKAQRAFVLGLIASDGHVSRVRNFAGISSADGRFIREVSWLLTALGVEHRLAHHGHLYQIQTKNLEETAKLLRRGAYTSHKHLKRWRHRLRNAQLSRLPQIPSDASGLLEVCRAARTVRVPRVSGVGVISKATARAKLKQIQYRKDRLTAEIRSKLPQLEALLGSSLVFARVLSVEEVPTKEDFVYCFRLADEPAGFFIEGGILTRNSFGYLGYRNARFGRIEAHEAVTAFSREMLLRAKEVAESRGFRMLHALVDSMWLQRPGATRADYEGLAQAVTGATGLSIFVEGIYRWIGFLPSKTHRGVGVPNRYMGVFDNDTTKVRGIEVRRSDMPALVVQMQEQMLQRMFLCPTLADVRTALPEILGILEDALVRLRAGDVEAAELVITNTLSQEVSEYRHNTVQAITARTLDRHGVQLHPGEVVQFVITNAGAKVPEDRVRPYALLGTDWNYDTEAYATLLLRAAATILELFGYSETRLRQEVWEPLTERAPLG